MLATILDLARQNIAILLLTNTTKDAANLKGRGEWADRADIVYEVRDATDFVPTGKKPWWQELPEAGEKAWADRAARRKDRTDFRLAFVCSKFRLGPEPAPFCVELDLSPEVPWTLRDVTAEVEGAIELELRRSADRVEEAAAALARLVRDRSTNRPVLKTEAENLLRERYQLARHCIRDIIDNETGKRWKILEQVNQKGKPKILLPLPDDKDRQKSSHSSNPDGSRASEASISADPVNRGGENNPALETLQIAGHNSTPFSPPEKSTSAKTLLEKPLSHEVRSDIAIAAIEKRNGQDTAWEIEL